MRTVTKSGLVLAILLVTSAASAADPATQQAPQTSADAPAHFQRALELYQEQDFAGALVEFRRAQELAPSYKMNFNIGQVCYQLTDYACAMRSFEAYLKEGGGSISSERRAEVDKEIAKLRLRVGHVEIVTNIPGVEIAVDDVPVGKTPLPQSVVLSTGKRRITGTHDGFAPVSRIVEVAGTDSSRVELVFSSGSGGGRSSEPKYESRWNTISWIGLGGAVAFGAVAGITGGIALDADNKLDKQPFAASSGPTSDMKSNQDKAHTMSVVSDVFLGASIATLAGTLVYTFVHKPKVVEAAPPEPKVDVSFTGTGAMLKGSF